MPGLSFTPVFLAQFKVLGLLGEGGMGVVYKAIQRSVDRLVAVKFLSRALLTDDYLPRFQAEARLAGRVIHTNLVAVFDAGVMDGVPYIVFEYVEGPSLRVLLARTGDDRPLGQALDLVRQAADGLGCAHRAGIVHRDVKPENLLVAPSNLMKVADFGIARGPTSATGAKTRTGILLGTPAYMAPEQALEEPAGPAADIYSLGVVLYEMIARRVPFHAASTLEILDQHVCSPPPALDEAVPLAVRRLVERALAKRPQERFESMAALSRELVRVGQTLIAHPGRLVPERARCVSSGTLPAPMDQTRRSPLASRSALLAERGSRSPGLAPTASVQGTRPRAHLWWAVAAIFLIAGIAGSLVGIRSAPHAPPPIASQSPSPFVLREATLLVPAHSVVPTTGSGSPGPSPPGPVTSGKEPPSEPAPPRGRRPKGSPALIQEFCDRPGQRARTRLRAVVCNAWQRIRDADVLSALEWLQAGQNPWEMLALLASPENADASEALVEAFAVGLATHWNRKHRERLSSLLEGPALPYRAVLRGTFQLCDGDPAGARDLYDSFIDKWSVGHSRIEVVPGIQVLAALAAFSISRPDGPGGPDPKRVAALRYYVTERPQGHLYQVAVDLVLSHEHLFRVPLDLPKVAVIHPAEPHQVIDGHLRFLVDRARMSMRDAARAHEPAPTEPPPRPHE